ncbi:MAG: class I SAM-dependent methyltransferase [Anaerolineales bacterium]|nr:class I SAM-dependent methyltransferase [Anaerolineales bacterium]
MGEFWEEAFKKKQVMWGEQPTVSAIETLEHFKNLGFQKILVPGFGYGRNAKPFLDNGFEVTGIEISKTAIELAYQLLDDEIKVFHGSVSDMPFNQDIYDGIFCHALIHLLKSNERKQLLTNCNAQLKSDGVMVFTAITKHASTYGVGEKLGKDLFKTKDGVELFFYDEESIKEEFEPFGLVEATLVEESPATKFWKIMCTKT